MEDYKALAPVVVPAIALFYGFVLFFFFLKNGCRMEICIGPPRHKSIVIPYIQLFPISIFYWALTLLKANFSPWLSSLASWWIMPDTISLLLLGKDNTPGRYCLKVLLKVLCTSHKP